MQILKNKKVLALGVLAIISLCFMIYFKFTTPKASLINYETFLNNLNNNEIKIVNIISDNEIGVTLKNNSSYITSNPDSPNFKENLLNKGISVTQNNNVPLKTTIPASVLVVAISLMFLTLANKNSSFNPVSKLNLKSINENTDFKFNFSSVAGNEEAKESVKDIIYFLKNPEKYKKYGARMPKGVILYGEPGTGKTLLAKAVAGEANVPFFAMSGSDFVQMYVGVGASRVRDLFKKAKARGKAVIFIDEIDAIGKKRASGKNASGNDERDQTLNALLTEMSGFSEKEGIVVMAATNRLDTLDSALLRPGRFDRHVEVSLPDINAREAIINLYLKNKPNKDINIRNLAEKTAYFSGAKIESLINEAAILAAKEDSTFIYEKHLNIAFSIITAGYEKNDTSYIKKEDRKITAFHEAGHALLSMILLPEDKVSKITIIPTTKGAGGYTLTIPEDKSYHTSLYLKRRIMVLLAGRASEELIFGKDKITTGAHNDIAKCTSMIKSMITEYGMGDSLGLLSLNSLENLQNGFSSNLLEEFKSLSENLYENCKYILKENIDILKELSTELLEKETLEYLDLEKYISKLKNK